MCGIVGYIGQKPASDILISGLQKLEYRGYDSAGIATILDGSLHCVRAKGKLKILKAKLAGKDNPASVGIGHTRWATHGKPEEHNAHPHRDQDDRLAVVQNGIVENYRELKVSLKSKGYEFLSETDTEVIPHLISDALKNNSTQESSVSKLFDAVQTTVAQLEGAFAIAVISADFPGEIIVARQQAPLVIGFGEGEYYCASDTPALIAYTRAILPLENEEIAQLTPDGVNVFNFAGDRLRKSPQTFNWNPMMVEKQGFRHFMLKEIHEQPGVVRACLEAYLKADWSAESSFNPIDLKIDPSLLQNLEQVQVISCGTSWHAGMVGKYLLEQLAQLPTQVHYASEFRYSPTPLMANTLTIGVTQSGETADTLAALEMEKKRRSNQPETFQSRLLGITNRPESSLSRLVPHIIDTHAGIEIGVAATKTFVAQVVAFYLLAIELAYLRKTLELSQIETLISGLRQLPAQIEQILESQERYVETLAHQFIETKDFIYIGRGINFPIALEGALKLKEISYIHAEAYPAGEMKHGPIALLDSKVPVVAIAMPGPVFDKVLSNAQEARARDSILIGVTPLAEEEAKHTFDMVLPVPEVDEMLSPILTSIPLQLLAYHIAALRGLDVDQPRNLAKSVTVE